MGSPHVWHDPTLPDRPIRGSRGPLAAGARSRARSYSARSHTSTTPWFTMSWLELINLSASRAPVRLGNLRNPKFELLDSFGDDVHHLLLQRLSSSSHVGGSATAQEYSRAAVGDELVHALTLLRAQSVAAYIWSCNDVAAVKVFSNFGVIAEGVWLGCSLQNDFVTLSILAWFRHGMPDSGSDLRTN